MKYNTQYICIYNSPDIFLTEEENNLCDADKEFVRDTLYRSDILNILNVEEFNEGVVNSCIHDIYEKIKNNYDFVIIMKKFAKFFFSDDCELGLLLMFSYDYLHFTHPCICELFETGKISDDNLNKLKDIIV